MSKRRKYWKEKKDVDWTEQPNYLRGLGHTQLVHQRGFRGSTLGPASRGRRLTKAERKKIEDQMRAEGKL